MRGSDIKTPICDFVKRYAEKDMSRFHMPGHKGAGDMEEKYDITEVNGADSLYEASGIIAQSEKNASDIFGTYATFYSVEGSSQAVRAMLALIRMKCAKEKCTVLAARNVHRSFVTAAALLDLNVEWLYPENKEFTLCSCILSSAQVREKLESMKNDLPDAIYITSPDYLGSLQDIKGMAEAAHEYGVPLLVDNAHGAYLHFLKRPLHPMDLGADLCCDSAHKTLPALTGCAYLHIGKNSKSAGFYKENAKKALSLFGSTSPSYILMSSLDKLNPYLADRFGDDLAQTAERISRLKAKLEENGWKLYGSEPLKITVEAADLSGEKIAQILRENNMECEYADPDYVVFMLSPYNKDGDLKRLGDVMAGIRTCKTARKKKCAGIRPSRVMSVKDAMFSSSENIPVSEAAGRILADAAISCPPAVPIVVSGEKIDREAIEIFDYYNIKNVNVVI